MDPQVTDAELLASTLRADFELFYVRHVDVVARYAGRRVARPDLTIDVVAETFARALEHRESFDPQRGPALAWLLRIARNVIYDASRRGTIADETRRMLQMQPLELNDADLVAIETRSAASLLDALEALPADQREAVHRRVLDEDSYPAIAKDIGCSEQVVRQRVHRGLRALRRRIKEQGT